MIFMSCHHFLRFLDLPALDSAIATAWSCGRPSFLSVRILDETVALDLPLFKGIIYTFLYSFQFFNEIYRICNHLNLLEFHIIKMYGLSNVKFKWIHANLYLEYNRFGKCLKMEKINIIICLKKYKIPDWN